MAQTSSTIAKNMQSLMKRITEKGILITFGFIRSISKELNIPDEIINFCIMYAFYVHGFDRENDKFSVSDDGLSMETIYDLVRGGRAVIRFGHWLSYKNGDKFECTFKLNNGSHSGLGFGFVTDKFEEYYVPGDSYGLPPKESCIAAANGYFIWDREKFKPLQSNVNSGHNGDEYQFMNSSKKSNTITLKCDMSKKIGYIGQYEIQLPDCDVAIVAFSTDKHNISVIFE